MVKPESEVPKVQFALLSVNIYLKARDLWVVDMFGKCVLCLSITPAN